MNNIELLEEIKNYLKRFENANVLNKKYCLALENIIHDYKELKEKLEEKEIQHELELLGKEEYTKAEMKEIIEQYYTPNEDCIQKSKIKEKIEELEKLQENNKKDLEQAINTLNFKEIEKISMSIAINLTVRTILNNLLKEEE